MEILIVDGQFLGFNLVAAGANQQMAFSTMPSGAV